MLTLLTEAVGEVGSTWPPSVMPDGSTMAEEGVALRAATASGATATRAARAETARRFVVGSLRNRRREFLHERRNSG